MALIVLTSASGSPGVTTTALALSLYWKRPSVLVEADPTGGLPVLNGWLHAITPQLHGTLADLSISHRNGTLTEDLPKLLMRLPDTAVDYLPGLYSHTQAPAMASVWAPLAEALRARHEHDQDVIVDAGRLGLASSPTALMNAADLLLILTRSSGPALAAAAGWAATLREQFAGHGDLDRLRAVKVGPDAPYGVKDITAVLQIPVLSALTADPKYAAVFTYGNQPVAGFDSSSLVRSYRSLARAIGAALEETRGHTTPRERS